MNDLRQQCQVLLNSMPKDSLYDVRDFLVGVRVFYQTQLEDWTWRQHDHYWTPKFLQEALDNPVYLFHSATITDYNRHQRLTFDVGDYDVEQFQRYADERANFNLSITLKKKVE